MNILKLLLKPVTIIIILVIIISSAVAIVYINNKDNEEKDTTPPTIDSITGNTTGKTGKITTIFVKFSDNKNVTYARLFYKASSDSTWQNISILDGNADIPILSDKIEEWYYYVVINDEAGNGPVGDPSTDGSKYYIITVEEEIVDLTHYVLVEESTATNCQYCPNVANILRNLYESGNYNFYYVSLVDDVDEFNTKALAHLTNDYNKYGNPTVYIDGGYKVIVGGTNSQSDYTDAIETAESRNVPQIQIEVSTEYNNNNDKLSTTVLIKNYETSTYNGHLRIYLTEINSRWYDYDIEPYHFAFIDFIYNDDISIGQKGEKTIEKDYDISDFDPENLMVIASIFNKNPVKSYSKPPDEYEFNAYYVDATDGVEVVEGGNRPPEVSITGIEEGKIHFRGNPIVRTITGKTILIGKTTLDISASDDTQVDRVEIYVDDELAATLKSSPYNWEISNPSGRRELLIREHEIKVIAYDETGKESAPYTIKVYMRL